MPARQVPPRPRVEQYKKQAKDLLKAYRSNEPDAMRRVREQLQVSSRPDGRPITLADAQFTIAREHGFASWPKFVRHVADMGGLSPAMVWQSAEKAIVAGDAAKLELLLRHYADVFRSEQPRSWWNNTLTADYHAGDARAIIASTHHFNSWDEFVAHRAAVRDRKSQVARFESAVDMVIDGDIAALTKALNDAPDLISARSKRMHHSTLLHYVGANGVEGFRQHTPGNIVSVAELLLDRGAEVNAVADMYGGATTLGLVATSLHPKRAGVQQPLIQLLLDRGATLHDGAGGRGRPLVRMCLANDRPEAAEYLASRGAPLDLVAAAGIGRLDVVQSSFSGGDPKPPVQELEAALLEAARFGHTDVAEYLLNQGISPEAEVNGFTAANSAATSGHLDMLRMLIARRASLEKKNRYGGTCLGGALWGLLNRSADIPAERYVAVIDLLVSSGATVPVGFVEWWKGIDEVSPDVHAAVLTMLASRATE
jgi:hypothetical protein